jgi:hypothetical protein
MKAQLAYTVANFFGIMLGGIFMVSLPQLWPWSFGVFILIMAANLFVFDRVFGPRIPRHWFRY